MFNVFHLPNVQDKQTSVWKFYLSCCSLVTHMTFLCFLDFAAKISSVMLILMLLLSWYNILLFFPFIYLLGRGCVCCGTYMEVRQRTMYCIQFSFPTTSWVLGLNSGHHASCKSLYPPSHLSSPNVLLKFSESDILTMQV